MDREILFRGKSVDNGKWVYGSLITEEPVNNNIKYYFIRTKYNDEYNAYHQVLVDADTIGQYTGLKDKNGKKVFTGDIIKMKIGKTLNGDNIYLKYCVNFSDTYGSYEAFAHGLGGYSYPGIGLCKLTWKEKDNEIIGNWWDSPQLLGGENDK